MPKIQCSCGKVHNFFTDPGRFVCDCGAANEADPKVAAQIAANAAEVAEQQATEAQAAAEKAKSQAAAAAEKAEAAKLSTPATISKEIEKTGETKTETADTAKKPLGFQGVG